LLQHRGAILIKSAEQDPGCREYFRIVAQLNSIPNVEAARDLILTVKLAIASLDQKQLARIYRRDRPASGHASQGEFLEQLLHELSMCARNEQLREIVSSFSRLLPHVEVV